MKDLLGENGGFTIHKKIKDSRTTKNKSSAYHENAGLKYKTTKDLRIKRIKDSRPNE